MLLKDALQAYRPVLVQRAGVLARLGRGEGLEQDGQSVTALLAAIEAGAQIAVLAPNAAQPEFSPQFTERVA